VHLEQHLLGSNVILIGHGRVAPMLT